MFKTLANLFRTSTESEIVSRHFDHAYYRRLSSDLGHLTDAQLVSHFCLLGWQEGRDPSPYFSTSRYLEAYPDIHGAQINPFLHYLRKGKQEGRKGCPQIALDIEFDLLKPDFDANYYREFSPHLAYLSDQKLLEHFHNLGWKMGLDPTAFFSVKRYLEKNHDVAATGVDPFLHYLTKGKQEGREARPATEQEIELSLMISDFDAEYYRLVSPHMAHLSDHELLEHFHNLGWKEDRDPSATFSVEKYIADNQDVAQARINPLLHYLTKGRAENRKVLKPLPRRWCHLTEAQIILLENAFNSDFYKNSQNNLDGTARSLLEHYIDTGWIADFDPSPDFSNYFYSVTYNDTKGVCPLIHFILGVHDAPRRGKADQPLQLTLNPDAVTAPHQILSVLKKSSPQKSIEPPTILTPKNGLHLHWVIPDFPKGSGGHMTIFRIIRQLEAFGHSATIWIEQPIFHQNAADVYDDIIKYFQCIAADVRFIEDGFFQTQGSVVIATSWTSAYYVNSVSGFAAKYYFVQDHETDFYPSGTERLLARQTYDFDLACICAGAWLEQIMRKTYGRWSRGFNLAYDRSVYHNKRDMPNFGHCTIRPNGRHKIAVYARQHTARRCVDLALMAIELLGLRRADFEVHLFGQDDMSFKQTPFRAFNHGVLNDKALAQLYNECDIGLCFSATNYSLVPQEMMACGLPVVELETDSTSAIFPKGVVTRVGPDPREICSSLSALLDDPERRQQQARRAGEWVNAFSWEDSARAVEDAIFSYLRETSKINPTPTIIPSRDIILDVVIPTFNGVTEIQKVISALRQQSNKDILQFHCVDSSSSDGTTQWLKAQPDVALTVIDKEEFQHGRTRNQAAAEGNAPFIAFLTQDAIPASTDWATDIIKMMRHTPKAAGLFGRHLPYPEHSLRVRQDINNHFKNLLQQPLALSRDTDPARWQSKDLAWRQLLHFYSDNNSALRRKIWQDIPYPEVDFGEDQLWARTIIEAGYTKIYAPTAVVYHSHDFTPQEAYARAHIEGHFLYEYFGYELGEGSQDEFELRVRMAQDDLVGWARKYQVATNELARQQDITDQKYRGWRDGRIQAQRAKTANMQSL